MNNSEDGVTGRRYEISIEPRILELLGPHLYTNIYFVLAELIANAYDADAHNVYIIEKDDRIVVEDDGSGMSYRDGDIANYLRVAAETRSESDNILTASGVRKRMGRKGVGKLAALSVSEKVFVMTSKNGEKSGFVLSRHVDSSRLLEPLSEDNVLFENVQGNGTSVVMLSPEYGLHKARTAIMRNLLKIFPLIGPEFRIHIINGAGTDVVDSFDKEMMGDLGGVVLLGNNFHHLAEYFKRDYIHDPKVEDKLLISEDSINIEMRINNKLGMESDYTLSIEGWIGFYRSTRGRKNDASDFPDNFISLFSNGKLGEYNVLPAVGKNRLTEVYVVGQLHVDLFEETELPDMALSNRQGYKTSDARYIKVISQIRDNLLPRILEMRNVFANHRNTQNKRAKSDRMKKEEENLKEKAAEYMNTASTNATEKIKQLMGASMPEGIRAIIKDELNGVMNIVGLKRRVDSQKKRVLISHVLADKALADTIFYMLVFNGVPEEEIIYTSCDDHRCRLPEDENIFDYLRDFFVNSLSDEKVYVIYITSETMAKNWFAVAEVGAGWITKSDHKIFNIFDHRPNPPLNVSMLYHTSRIDNGRVTMNSVKHDEFAVKIGSICNQLGYAAKDKDSNKRELLRHITVT